MKMLKAEIGSGVMLLLGLTACSTNGSKSPDVSQNIKHSLDAAGLKDVSVTQDRDKGIVTLNGQVPSEGDKANADSIAKSLSGNEVVSDQIAVIPAGAEDAARTINSDLDKGIEKNLDAMLIENHLKERVGYDVKNGVVTLTGDVNSETRRADAERVASRVPNVQQVVNELQVKDQKATSTR